MILTLTQWVRIFSFNILFHSMRCTKHIIRFCSIIVCVNVVKSGDSAYVVIPVYIAYIQIQIITIMCNSYEHTVVIIIRFICEWAHKAHDVQAAVCLRMLYRVCAHDIKIICFGGVNHTLGCNINKNLQILFCSSPFMFGEAYFIYLLLHPVCSVFER